MSNLSKAELDYYDRVPQHLRRLNENIEIQNQLKQKELDFRERELRMKEKKKHSFRRRETLYSPDLQA